MKKLSSNWPLQLVKVTGSVIPPLDFNLFGLEGLLHKKIELLLFGSLKLPKIHPFHIILYFFKPKGLYEKKGLLEFSLHPFQTL